MWKFWKWQLVLHAFHKILNSLIALTLPHTSLCSIYWYWIMGDNFDISLIKYCDEDEKLSADDIPASDDDACAPFPEVPELSRAQWGEKLKPLLCCVAAVEWGLWKSVIALGGESTKKK